METATKGYNLTTTVNHFNLSYDDLGEKNVPVIFLHGYPFNKSMWKAQLEYLKSSNRVIACDIRGFGKSTDEESALSMDLFADDLIQFMDKLKIEKAIICGLSMGGFITLNANHRYPNRFKALILCDTQCIADTPEVKEKRFKTIEDINTNGVNEFNEGFLQSVFCKDSLNTKKALVEDLRKVVFANSPHIITAGLTALAGRTDTCATLGAIQIPTMIICGREDTVTPLIQSEYMYATITNSILHVIEKAGHVSNLEQPEIFNKKLSQFLNDLNASNSDVEQVSQRSLT
ncbi:MAG: alpha/beta hydrolase [Bacteroidia bacterium]|jgi:pimeloyl-ACP methyl ester carboxylesterase